MLKALVVMLCLVMVRSFTIRQVDGFLISHGLFISLLTRLYDGFDALIDIDHLNLRILAFILNVDVIIQRISIDFDELTIDLMTSVMRDCEFRGSRC